MDYVRSLLNHRLTHASSPDLRAPLRPLVQPKKSNESVRSEGRLSIPGSETRSIDDRPPFVPDADDQTSLKMTSSRGSNETEPSPGEIRSEYLNTFPCTQSHGRRRSYSDPLNPVPLEIRLRRASKASRDSSRRGSLLPFMVHGAHPKVENEGDHDLQRKSTVVEPTTTLASIAVVASETRSSDRRKRKTSETYEVIWEGYYLRQPSPREEEVIPNPPNTAAYGNSLRSSAEDDGSQQTPIPFLAAEKLSKRQTLVQRGHTRRSSGSAIGASANKRRTSLTLSTVRKLSNLEIGQESPLSHTDSIAVAKQRMAHVHEKKLSGKSKAAAASPKLYHPHGAELADDDG